ncbi:ABC transporter permease [Spirosoma endbachense]|nr:ABC transporter permease [Spirosoma endbachense]
MATNQEQTGPPDRRTSARQPPRWADRLLERFVSPYLLEDVQGDLQEIFHKRVAQVGIAQARREYGWAVLHYLNPFFAKPHYRTNNLPKYPQFSSLHPIMIRNYLKIAWRNLAKNRVFSLINIFGLAIGMTTCLLILEVVSFQLSFDTFHTNANHIYRVVNDRYQQGKLIQHGTITYSGVGKAMKDDFPDEVLTHSRVVKWGDMVLDVNNTKHKASKIAVDNSFLSMFSFPLLAGDKKSVLVAPNTIVLTERLAKRMFGIKNNDYQSILGKTVKIDNSPNPYKLTGVCSDIPENSHLDFDFLMSYSSLYSGGNFNYKEADYNFTDSDFWHYIQLKPNIDYRAVQAKLDAFSKRHFQGNAVSGSDEKFYLQPLSEVHLYSDFEYEIGKVANGQMVWGLFAIAVFMIVIAWINYVNLSTAKAVERAKEVGIRKVAGSQRGQLIRQFLIESFGLNLIALILTLLFLAVSQTGFNRLTNLPLSLANLFNQSLTIPYFPFYLLLAFGLGVVLSGYYPAFILSSFQPLAVLKGKFMTTTKGITVRKSLVVFQFTATIFLLFASIVMFRQLKFMSEKDLGIHFSQILSVTAPSLASNDSSRVIRAETFKQSLKQIGGVMEVAYTDREIGGDMARTFDVQNVGGDKNTKLTMRHFGVSREFLSVYQVKLLAGRNFVFTDYNYKFDLLHNVILNQKAIKQLGYSKPDDAIGKQLKLFGRNWDIVGVVDNFHQKGLRSAVDPLILIPTYSTSFPISVKVETQNLEATLAAIKSVYKSFFPQDIFGYAFVDERFNQQYNNDQLLGEALLLFSGLLIFVACLGLFGLSFFVINQRTKEIGVRKVLGASVMSITALVSKDFLKLVVIAMVIATPIGWYTMRRWLNDFAYKIDIEWWMFGLAGLLAMGIALLTVSFQSIKAALLNPVKSLRTE